MQERCVYLAEKDDPLEKLFRAAAALIVEQELAKPLDERNHGLIDYCAERSTQHTQIHP